MDTADGKNQDRNEIMTVREVAEYLQLSEATIYLMARNGQIPAARIGKTWRFKKNVINDWLVVASELSEK